MPLPAPTHTPQATAEPDPAILERNIAALATQNPAVARAIAESAPHPALGFDIASDGALTASLDGRALASRRQPLDEARRLAEAVDLNEAGGVVVLGFALGHHLAALAERARGASVFVVFEPDIPLLRSVLERIDHSAWITSAQFRLITAPDNPGALTGAIKGLEGPMAIGVSLLDHPPSRARLAHVSARFHQTFQTAFAAARTQIITTMMQTDVTVRNELMNIEHFVRRPGIADLRDRYAGRPAILVAAGPSLRRNVHLLETEGLRDRCLIIAVQTVLKQLLARGVAPHFVTAIDYHEISRRFYEDLDPDAVADTTLIAECRANPAVLDTYPGPIRVPDDEFLRELLGWGDRPERGQLTAAATVAHLSYYLARYLGADPVILIGQDLAFTDGQYYARDAAIHDVWASELGPFASLEQFEWQRIVRFKGHLREITDHLGRRAYTDDQMATYLAQFERDFQPDLAAGKTIIDATEGGVAKRGATIMPLAAALERFAPPGEPPLPVASTPEPVEDPDLVAEVRATVRRVCLDERRITRATRQAREMLVRMLAEHDDTARVNRLINQVNEIRDEVQALQPAFSLLMRLNQLGALKRFKADRLIRLAEDLDPREQQRRQIERDDVNLQWIEELSDLLGELLDIAEKTFDGHPKRTHDIAPPALEAERVSDATALIAVACVPLPAARLGELTAPLAGAPVIQRTLERLARCQRIDGVALLTDQPEPVRRMIDGLTAEIETHVIETSFDEARARAIGAARRLAPDAWRSGLGGLTVFDEVLDPIAALAAPEALGADAIVVVGPDWVALDPSLTDEVIARHAEAPEANPFTFTQAPPGVAPLVLGAGYLASLAEAQREANPYATVGAALGYVPTRPRSDPIAKTCCVQIDSSIRGALYRFIPDSPATHAALDHVLSDPNADDSAAAIASRVDAYTDGAPPEGPTHLTLELTTARPGAGDRFSFLEAAPERTPIDTGLACHILEQAAQLNPSFGLTLAGFGDPLEHPGALAIIHAARDAGVTAIHLRTDLACERSTADALLDAPIDVLSVDVLAHQAETYRRITGRDAYARVIANLDALLRVRQERGPITTPWIVPRITRRDMVYDELEVFYDKWLLLAGAACIDPLLESIAGERIEPLGRPTTTIRRDARSRLTVLCDGSVIPGDRGLDGAERVATLTDTPLADAWRAVVLRRDEHLRAGRLDHSDLATIW